MSKLLQSLSSAAVCACVLWIGPAEARRSADRPDRPHAGSRRGSHTARKPRVSARTAAAPIAGPIAAPGAAPSPAAEPAEPEPVPAGEHIVPWAMPRTSRLGVKIRLAPSRSADTIGEMRGHTAIRLLTEGEGGQPRSGPGCRAWLQAATAGFVCESDVAIVPRYLSDPPAEESATTWQRYRYGVVRSASAELVGSGGGTRYLRETLHRGDGVTVVRERSDQLQLYSHQWLSKDAVELATPPGMGALALADLPAPQRLRVAWAVPPLGSDQVALYPAGGGRSGQPLWLPRYSLVLVEDAAAGAAPGRVAVTLPEATRVSLTAVAGPPLFRSDVAGGTFELDAAQLRRVTPAAPPAEVGPDEHWLDISLSQQVAVAYVGRQPTMAALVSTGKHSTPPGSFFIYRKYRTQTMANQRGAAAQYDFREVPHAQFFNGRIGLHAVLWHNLLGHPVSHGCVNLSPEAAAQFFAFTGPQLPAGWHSVAGFAPPEAPASGEPAGASGPSRAAATVPARPRSRPQPGAALIGTRVVVRR